MSKNSSIWKSLQPVRISLQEELRKKEVWKYKIHSVSAVTEKFENFDEITAQSLCNLQVIDLKKNNFSRCDCPLGYSRAVSQTHLECKPSFYGHTPLGMPPIMK